MASALTPVHRVSQSWCLGLAWGSRVPELRSKPRERLTVEVSASRRPRNLRHPPGLCRAQGPSAKALSLRGVSFRKVPIQRLQRVVPVRSRKTQQSPKQRTTFGAGSAAICSHLLLGVSLSKHQPSLCGLVLTIPLSEFRSQQVTTVHLALPGTLGA